MGLLSCGLCVVYCRLLSLYRNICNHYVNIFGLVCGNYGYMTNPFL